MVLQSYDCMPSVTDALNAGRCSCKNVGFRQVACQVSALAGWQPTQGGDCMPGAVRCSLHIAAALPYPHGAHIGIVMLVTTAWQARAALPWRCRNCISWLCYKTWPHTVACTRVALVLCCMPSRVSQMVEL
jgi:hypothetical protein